MSSLKTEILDWVRETADRLGRGEDLGTDLPTLIDYVSRHLDLIYADCEPEASHEIRRSMDESIDLYHRSLDCLDIFLEETNPKLLGLAVRSAQEATDLLALVRSRLAQGQA